MEEIENAPTPTRIALKWGAIAGLIMVLYYLLMQITGLITNMSLAPLYYVVMLLAMGFGMFKAMDEYKLSHQGYISYGQGLGLNTMLAAVAAVISTTVSLLYTTFIDNSAMKKMLDMQKEKMVEQWEKQGMSEKQIDDALEMTDKMAGVMQNPGIMFVSGVFTITLIGFIIALVITAIRKKDKPVFE